MRHREFGERPRFVDFPNRRFVPDNRVAKGRCFLDGVDITAGDVYFASEASGEVRCHALDENGHVYWDLATGAAAIEPPRFGVVDIYLHDEEPPT